MLLEGAVFARNPKIVSYKVRYLHNFIDALNSIKRLLCDDDDNDNDD